MTGVSVVASDVKDAYEHQVTSQNVVGSTEDVVLHFDNTAAAVLFKRQAGALLIDPSNLDALREVSDRGLGVVIEEARFHSPDAAQQRQSENDSEAPGYMRCIVKSYRCQFIGTQAELQGIVDEAKRIHALKHPNIIQLLGIGAFKQGTQADLCTSFFYVEEFAGSWSLFKMLRSKWLHPTHPHVQFNTADCFRWCIDIADALAFLHAHQVVHRDIKAENIFLTDTDVHETKARIGDLKPHRRNFRKHAYGHVRTTRARDLPDPNEPAPESPKGARPFSSAMSQFSLSRHNSIALRNMRLNRSQLNNGEEDKSAGIPAPGPALEASRSFKKKELTSSFRLRHNNEALPLLVSKEHPDLGELDESEFVKALEKKIEEEVDPEIIKTRPSVETMVKRMSSGRKGSLDPALEELIGGGSGSPAGSGRKATGSGRSASGSGRKDASGDGDGGKIELTGLRVSSKGRDGSGRASSPSAAKPGASPFAPAAQQGFQPGSPEAAAKAAGDPNVPSAGYSRLANASGAAPADGQKPAGDAVAVTATARASGDALAGERKDSVPLKSKRTASIIAKPSTRKDPSIRVTFREGVPEGLPATEDYSLIYAPPEYVRDANCDSLKALSYKGDVFSFGKVMYEIFSHRLINPCASVGAPEGWHTSSETLHAYAKKVAEGHRETIPVRWPASVRALISQCWAEDPTLRPGMAFVANRLRELSQDPDVLAELLPPTPPPEPAKEVDSDEEMEHDYYTPDNDDEEEDEEDEDEEMGDPRESSGFGGSGRMGGSGRIGGSGRMNAGSGRMNVGSGRMNVNAGSGRMQTGSGRMQTGSGRVQAGSGRRPSNSGAPEAAGGMSRTSLGRTSAGQAKPGQSGRYLNPAQMDQKKAKSCCVIS